MEMFFKKVFIKAVPHVLFAAFMAVMLFLCLRLDAGIELTYFLVFSLAGFYLLVCFVVIPYIKGIYTDKIKKIYRHFTFSRYDSSKSFLSQLVHLERSMGGYVRNRRSAENVMRDRESFQKDFIGNLSHELKTPLFTVQGYLLTLLEGGLDDRELTEKYLRRASIGVERLSSVIKDLDTITKLESGKNSPVKEPFDMVALVRDLVDMMDIEAAERGVVLQMDGDYDRPVMVLADEMRIEQVLTNLITNSIRYSKDTGGRVSVKLYESGEKVITQVSDNGKGISPENLPRVFERFYRVDKSRSRENGGSGLGLSIVKHIIESHGEGIEAESELGSGTTFRFTLQSAAD